MTSHDIAISFGRCFWNESETYWNIGVLAITRLLVVRHDHQSGERVITLISIFVAVTGRGKDKCLGGELGVGEVGKACGNICQWCRSWSVWYAERGDAPRSV